MNLGVDNMDSNNYDQMWCESDLIRNIGLMWLSDITFLRACGHNVGPPMYGYISDLVGWQGGCDVCLLFVMSYTDSADLFGGVKSRYSARAIANRTFI